MAPPCLGKPPQAVSITALAVMLTARRSEVLSSTYWVAPALM